MVKTFLFMGVAALALGATATDIKIKSNVKEGDVLGGAYTLVVTCDAASTVTQVEFYLDDNLVNSDSSTPYEFKLDTLTEPEGDHVLTIAAYTTDGSSKTEKVKFKIDNKIALGAKAHTERAEEALRDQKFDDALFAGRVALKADPKYVPAMIVLGRAYLGKGVYDEAQKYLDDATEAQPTNYYAWDMLAQLQVRKAINVRVTGADLAKAAEDEKIAYMAAIDAHRKSLDIQLNNLGNPTAANRAQRLDLMQRMGHLSEARAEVKVANGNELNNVQMLNTGMYLDLRRSSLADAQKTYSDITKKGLADGITYALGACLASLQGDDANADVRIQQAIKMDRSSLLIKLAQAFVTVDRGKNAAARALAGDLASSDYVDPQVFYYLARIYYELGEYEQSRSAYENALIQDPMIAEIYVSRGLEALRESTRATGDAQKRLRGIADNYFEIALKAKPESPDALIGKGLVSAYSGDKSGALKYGAAAQVVGGQAAWVNYVVSGLFAYGGQLDKANNSLQTAVKQNPTGIAIIAIPSVADSFKYLVKWGRTPVLVHP